MDAFDKFLWLIRLMVIDQRDKKGIGRLLCGRATWGLSCYLWAFAEAFGGCLGDHWKVGSRTVDLVLHSVSGQKYCWPVKTPRVL